jgi:Spx/MgsR family transcriptional regulator
MNIVYGIPNCDTVKRARAWFTEHAAPYQFHDFKKLGVPADKLPRWLSELGWERVLNRSGTTWRKLDDEAKAAVVDAASACALMLANPSVIKRPIVEWADGQLTVGFSPEIFAEHV